MSVVLAPGKYLQRKLFINIYGGNIEVCLFCLWSIRVIQYEGKTNMTNQEYIVI